MNRNWLGHIVKKSIPDKRGRQGEDCADLWRSSQFRLFLRANDHVISCDLQITSVASVGFIINLQHPTLTVYLPTWSFRFFLCNLLNGFCSLLVPPLSHDPSNLSFLYFPPIQFKFCGPHFLTCSQLWMNQTLLSSTPNKPSDVGASYTIGWVIPLKIHVW